jgi:solute carrier family 35 (UDP-sugar transporter), member A1/2/3
MRVTRKNCLNFLGIMFFILLSTASAIAVRESRIRSETAYSTSLVLVLIDAGKLFICVCTQAVFREELGGYKLFDWNSSVPAVLYTWQTQLLLYAAKFLDSTTFQLLGQMKILTTAAFARLILQRHLSGQQYVSLVILVAGTSLAISRPRFSVNRELEYFAVAAMLAAAVSSGFAGVWTEKCLKGNDFLITNIQMSLSSAILASFQFLMADFVFSKRVASRGIFLGFNGFTIAVIVLQIIAGLLIGLLLKHADSIIKNFAVSLSLILTCFVDIAWHGHSVSHLFIISIGLVILSLLMYAEASIYRSLLYSGTFYLCTYAAHSLRPLI